MISFWSGHCSLCSDNTAEIFTGLCFGLILLSPRPRDTQTLQTRTQPTQKALRASFKMQQMVHSDATAAELKVAELQWLCNVASSLPWRLLQTCSASVKHHVASLPVRSLSKRLWHMSFWLSYGLSNIPLSLCRSTDQSVEVTTVVRRYVLGT